MLLLPFAAYVLAERLGASGILSAVAASEDQGSKQLDIAISADGVFSVNNQLLPKNDLASLMEIGRAHV